MIIVYLFVSCARVGLCRFLSSFWCRGLAMASAWALTGLFCLPFYMFCYLNESDRNIFRNSLPLSSSILPPWEIINGK